MPRLSMWKDGKQSFDYKFMDRTILEMLVVGGTSALVHKYLGPVDQGTSDDQTQPEYTNQSEKNIQDLLLLENRDRVYSSEIYNLRCQYHFSDSDFDLSQFGIFLANGTILVTFHMNDMVEKLGRKLMAGDVLELPHLKEFWSLDETVPVALKRYYVVQEGNRSAEGFSPTWWPHLWRVKCNPMVDSQEYSQILNAIAAGTGGNTVASIISTYDPNIIINDAIVNQAQADVPSSGYDTEPMWAALFEDGDNTTNPLAETASPDQKFTGYLVSNGTAPNGYNVSQGTAFPGSPTVGEYVLRVDYSPARLFRYNGVGWQPVSNAVRTPLTPGTGDTLRDTFINNRDTITDQFGNIALSAQNLNTVFRPDKQPSPSFINLNGATIVPFSSTPTFDLSNNTMQVITLSGDASAIVINPSNVIYTFVIIQDDVGGHTFTWPSNFRGAGSISPTDNNTDPNTTAIQTFAYVSLLNEFVATTAMVYE